MSDPNDALYESELGELVNPKAENEQTPITMKHKKGTEDSSSKENQKAKNQKTLMAKLSKLDNLDDDEDLQQAEVQE